MIDSFHQRRAVGAFVAVCLAFWASTVQVRADTPKLRIFAAASLISALPDALEEWDGETTLIHAGSSTLARQIEQGAGADIFISADPVWVASLEDAGLTSGAPAPLLGNTLVAVAPTNAPSAVVPPFPDGALLALADTSGVPAGRYARRALEQAGDWPPKARLLETAHVREALAWAARGEVDYAIVYQSDAAAEPRVNVVAEFAENPDQPIRYVGAVVAGAREGADALLAYLKGPEAQSAFARHGFTPLGD